MAALAGGETLSEVAPEAALVEFVPLAGWAELEGLAGHEAVELEVFVVVAAAAQILSIPLLSPTGFHELRYYNSTLIPQGKYAQSNCILQGLLSDS